jgi:hypothetical protein
LAEKNHWERNILRQKKKLWGEENIMAEKEIMKRGKYHGRKKIMGEKNIMAEKKYRRGKYDGQTNQGERKILWLKKNYGETKISWQKKNYRRGKYLGRKEIMEGENMAKKIMGEQKKEKKQFT